MTVPVDLSLEPEATQAEIIQVLNIMNEKVNANTVNINKIIEERNEFNITFSNEMHKLKEDIVKEFNMTHTDARREIQTLRDSLYLLQKQIEIDDARRENSPSTIFDTAIKDVIKEVFKLGIVAGITYLAFARFK